MAIEFRCSQCSQLLRVPDDSAGKNARCPKCQQLMTVPAASPSPAPLSGAVTSFSPSPLPSAPAPFPTASAPPKPAAGQSPFGQAAGGTGGGSPPPPSNPFAGLGTAPPPKPPGNPFGDGGSYAASTNPYASPAYAYSPTASAGPHLPITNVVVPLEAIMSHAFRVWQANLGLLIVITILPAVITWVVAIPLAIMQGVMEVNHQPEAAMTIAIIAQVLQQLLALFLGIGQSQIALKLARGYPATIGELFGGGPRFLPVLGAGLIAIIVFYAGILACIVPGILLALWFWPFYYLLIERRAGILESFSLASKVTEGNRGTTFVIFLCGFGIALLGILALCVGLLFALPLISVMWATAYLMMAGQIPSQPQYVPQYQPQYVPR